MSAPMITRFTRLLPVALGALLPATHDESGLTFIRVGTQNAILDIVSSPQPAAGVNYEIRIIKNNIDTGRRVYSTMSDPASAGRVTVGPIALSPGDYRFDVQQVLGALTAYSFIVKFMRQP